MSSNTRSSKRSAAEAQLPNTDATIVAPAAPAAVAMSDASSSELLAAGGPAPQPQVDGFTAPVPAVAEETASHKAKRIATEAAHSVQVAVSAGLESASAAVNSAAASAKTWSDRELVRTGHSNAEGATPLNSELPVEPTLRDKTHNALNTAQGYLESAAESTLAATKVAAAKIAEGIHALGEKIEPHAAAISAKSADLTEKALAQGNATIVSLGQKIEPHAAALSAKSTDITEKALAQGNAALVKGKAAIHHATSGDKTDASHSMEKKDGSLPVERNADEFSTHAKFEGDSRIAGSSTVAPGQSGLGTDKVVDAPLAKIDAAPSADLAADKPLVV